jgi:hypothetical protein
MENKARPALEVQTQGKQQQQQQQPQKQANGEAKSSNMASKGQQPLSHKQKKKRGLCTCKVTSRSQHYQQKGCFTNGKLKNVPNGSRGAQSLPTNPQKGGNKEANVANQFKSKTSRQGHSSSDYETAPEEDKGRKVRVKKEGKNGLPVPVPLLPKDIPLPCSDAEEEVKPKSQQEEQEENQKPKPLMNCRDLEMVDWRAALLA